MKTVIKYGSLWLLPLAIYIFEIVWVCIKGATLTNAICGWACCISITLLLAVRCVSDIYHSQKRLEDAEKEFQKSWEEYCKLCDERTDNIDDVKVVEIKGIKIKE